MIVVRNIETCQHPQLGLNSSFVQEIDDSKLTGLSSSKAAFADAFPGVLLALSLADA